MHNTSDIVDIDTPALLVNETTVLENIANAIKIAGGDASRLRPHVKTHKTREVCRMLMNAGITKFKCATIAEAEMLALVGVKDILLAYQPVGPKILRLMQLINAYPDSRFSCLVDNFNTVIMLNKYLSGASIKLNVFIDINLGMNRTGARPEDAKALAAAISKLHTVRIRGVHGYDGHIRDTDPDARRAEAMKAYKMLSEATTAIESVIDNKLTKVIGGTLTFPMHISHPDVECSPGTFVFNDYTYRNEYEDLPFLCAAILMSRVISIIDGRHICIDLGYKSVASEMPLPRIWFINTGHNMDNARVVSHSEEHMTIEVEDAEKFLIGGLVYAIPYHICPTVALYESIYLLRDGKIAETWRVIARDRYINI